MRTNTLIATAALGALSAASALAQVYSVNAVGYINLTVPAGFSIIANQLNAGGNKVTDVFANIPDGSTLYKYDGTKYVIDAYDATLGWDDATLTVRPGEGFWIRIPGTASATITLVGEVPQGTLSTPVNKGFNLVSSAVPQSAALVSVLKYTPGDGDTIYFYRAGKYVINAYDATLGWDNGEPVPNVGEGFWIRASAASTWTRTFSVNQ
jgi:hypothetical protein